MNYQELAEKFIKEHEGVGYQSHPQIVAVKVFAKWLEENDSQKSTPDCPTLVFLSRYNLVDG